MPDDTLSEAIKEAFACAPSNVVYLNTLEIRHADMPESIYLVQDRKDWLLTLEGGGGTKTFKGCAFRFSLPPKSAEGIQNLNIAIDNINREVSDFIESVKESTDPVEVIYRPYLSNDTSTPQSNPPLVLTLRDIVINAYEVTGRASMADLLNLQFPHPSEIYTRERFPSLGNL